MAQRIDRALTRIEIKTTCMAAHAAEGRNAVYECVWDAIQEQFGDRDHRLDARDRCSRDRASQSDVTIPAPSTAEGSDAVVCDVADDRDIRGERGNNEEGRDRTGGRDSAKDS